MTDTCTLTRKFLEQDRQSQSSGLNKPLFFEVRFIFLRCHYCFLSLFALPFCCSIKEFWKYIRLELPTKLFCRVATLAGGEVCYIIYLNTDTLFTHQQTYPAPHHPKKAYQWVNTLFAQCLSCLLLRCYCRC